MQFLKKYIKELIEVLSSVQISILAAQTSFFMLLAFFPFCILMLLFISSIKIDNAIFIETVTSFLPKEVIPLFLDIVKNAAEQKNIFWSLTGILATVWISSRAVSSLIIGVNSFNKEKKRWKWPKRTGLAVGVTVSLMLCIVISILFVLFGKEALGTLLAYLGQNPDEFFNLWGYLKIPGTLLVLTGFFTMLYKIMSNDKMYLKDALPGAVFTSVFWFILVSAFSYLISAFFRFSSIYGSIGSIILMMMWLHWGTHIILIGAAVNKAALNIKGDS